MPLPGKKRRANRRRRRNRPTAEDRRATRNAPEGWTVKDGVHYWDKDPEMTEPAPKNTPEHWIRVKEAEQPILANRGGLVKSGISRYKDIHLMENR